MNNRWLVLIGQVLASWCVWGQPAAPPPARVVTSYNLTWSGVTTVGLPTAWRLLASNDGQNWNVLDVETNQPAANALRKTFQVSNDQAFQMYRLQVDANSLNASREASFAEIELLGPVKGVDRESDL